MGNQRGFLGEGVAGDPEIVGADRIASILEAGELFGVVAADGRAGWVDDRHLPRQTLQPAQHLGLAATALGALEQFGPGHERHGQGIFVG